MGVHKGVLQPINFEYKVYLTWQGSSLWKIVMRYISNLPPAIYFYTSAIIVDDLIHANYNNTFVEIPNVFPYLYKNQYEGALFYYLTHVVAIKIFPSLCFCCKAHYVP